MNRVSIKPLSVNRCWQGRRFKTVQYKNYEHELLLKLKPYDIPTGHLELDLIFGLSTMLADIDNPVKPFLDVLQKKYGFNDRDVMKMTVEKVKVAKGDEFASFNLREFNQVEEIKC